MNLTSVKYQDSCIFIGLNGSQNERENEALLQKIRNVYVVYKIKAFDRQVRETIVIGNKDLHVKKKGMILKFELNELKSPEECEIELIWLKFNYINGNIEELKINKSFSLLEIRSFTRIEEAGNRNPSKKSKTKSVRKTQSQKQPIKTLKLTDESKKKFVETKITPGGFTIIEEATPISTIVEQIETKIQTKLDAETKKLDMDLNKLCYETMDLLLSNLPQPVLVAEYRASNAMVKSIHRYINTELLQNEFEGGESA